MPSARSRSSASAACASSQVAARAVASARGRRPRPPARVGARTTGRAAAAARRRGGRARCDAAPSRLPRRRGLGTRAGPRAGRAPRLGVARCRPRAALPRRSRARARAQPRSRGRGSRARRARRCGRSASPFAPARRAARRPARVRRRTAASPGANTPPRAAASPSDRASAAWSDPGCRRRAEVGRQARDRGPRAAVADEGPGHAGRQAGERQRAGEEDRREDAVFGVLGRVSRSARSRRPASRGRRERCRHEHRPQRSAPRARRTHAAAIRRTRRGRGRRATDTRSQIGVERPREIGLGVDEEDVVGAVAPAAEVQEGISEQRAAGAEDGRCAVDRRDGDALASVTSRPVGNASDEMDEQRQQERLGEHGEAANERWALLSGRTQR